MFPTIDKQRTGQRSSYFRNSLSKYWWVGRLLYDENNAVDPFYALKAIGRHTFCTRLCENESNLKVIQSVMGHSDIQTTMDIYAECTQEKKAEVFANLNGKIMVK